MGTGMFQLYKQKILTFIFNKMKQDCELIFYSIIEMKNHSTINSKLYSYQKNLIYGISHNNFVNETECKEYVTQALYMCIGQ